jgi:hypothetical protein
VRFHSSLFVIWSGQKILSIFLNNCYRDSEKCSHLSTFAFSLLLYKV